jgi:Ca2+-binding EF-hand superfamily protein
VADFPDFDGTDNIRVHMVAGDATNSRQTTGDPTADPRRLSRTSKSTGQSTADTFEVYSCKPPDYYAPNQVPNKSDDDETFSLPEHLLRDEEQVVPSLLRVAKGRPKGNKAETKVAPDTAQSTTKYPSEDEGYYDSKDESSPKTPGGRRMSVIEIKATATNVLHAALRRRKSEDSTEPPLVGSWVGTVDETSQVAKIVRSDHFDYFWGFILIANSVVMGLRVDWTASNLGKHDADSFIWADRMFCILFLTELSLRLYTFRLSFYTMNGWQWAYFDTVIVGFQCFEEVVLLAEDSEGMNIGFLKMLKMGRLLRMVRMVRLLPELKSLVCLIMASMSSFVWTCVLLMLLVYMLAVYMTMMAVDVLSEKVNDQPTENIAELKLMWGSVGSSILSIYWSITGGQDWADVIGPLIQETGNQIHNIIFCMFIAFATMVLMNLVTGVFVEGAARLTKEDRDKELSRLAHKVFRLVDADGNEEISKEEFDNNLALGNMDTYLHAVELARSDAASLFDILDMDRSGAISVNEFVDGCLRLRGLPRAADLSQVLMETRKTSMRNKEWFTALAKQLEKTRRDVQTLKSQPRTVNKCSGFSLVQEV